MTSGGSRRRECPASAKKPTRLPTGAVCRSCTTMPVSIRAPPPGGKTGTVFPDLVPGAGTLPVGFQGRSASGRPRQRKSPVCEVCISGFFVESGRITSSWPGRSRRGLSPCNAPDRLCGGDAFRSYSAAVPFRLLGIKLFKNLPV